MSVESLCNGKQFGIHFRELKVPLRRAESGLDVHIAWCSLVLMVEDIELVSGYLNIPGNSLRPRELMESVKSSIVENLQRFESSDLTKYQSQRRIEADMQQQTHLLPGLKVKECTIRRILTQQQYLEEKIALTNFEIQLTKMAHDEEIWQETEKRRRALAKIENDQVRMLLTSDEKKMSPVQRFERYLEIFGLAEIAIDIQKRILDETKKGVVVQDQMLHELRDIRRALTLPEMAQPISRRSEKEHYSEIETILNQLESMQCEDVKNTLDELAGLNVAEKGD